MSQPILLRGARQLLTLRGANGPRRGADLRELAIVQDGALLIRDGIIDEVGPSRRVENLASARGAREINASGRVVLPGFVDSHTHLLHAMPGQSLTMAAENRWEELPGRSKLHDVYNATAGRMESHIRPFVESMFRHGTTTIEAKTGYGRDETGELKILRVLAALDGKPLDVTPTFLASNEVPAAYWDNLPGHVEWVCQDLLPKIARRKLASFADVVCGGAYSREGARRYLSAARDLGFGLKMHAGLLSEAGLIRLAVELGAVSIDHVEQCSDDDIELLGLAPTIATLMPGPVFQTGGEGYAPARALIDRGAAVALASDFNPDACGIYNMQTVISLACSCMKMTVAEAISAATINGAHAIRRGRDLGSLEPNKRADVIMLNLSDYRDIPRYFGVNSVCMTMKGGTCPS